MNSTRARKKAIVLDKIHPDDEALELMYFGWRGMSKRADEYLATIGLSRVHHRILYSVARAMVPPCPIS